ncbi:ECF RNA polymerase sigma factor SigK [Microbispora corallina]|uniref:RNA polymerase sigma factor SigK n=1 Tax=Microbispora corallina TaxID=83302 RepID=A0ABQ4G6F0_9ACTN|nr:ECF RNA polymerase sigma factor SigK [Microbispora corallina]GIH42609.1 RNA polymerase sigma factor SigK [Microbispora corallina]
MGPDRPTVRPGDDRPSGRAGDGGLERLMGRVARGDHAAFEEVYDQVAGQVYGLVLRVLRNPAQSEEVAQDVLVEVWRSAARYDPSKGSARAWVMTVAHRRAVDRVRSAQAAATREERVARLDVRRPFDEVADSVERTLDVERLRRCLNGLTELQRESVTFAYYEGYTYREVAELLKVPLATVKTRMRDGLIRMRDCLGVER